MTKHSVALVLVVVSAVAVWVSPASAITSPQVFSLVAVDNGEGQPINGFMFQRAPAPGDQFAISQTLHKWAGTKRGAKVGTDLGVGMFLTATPGGGSQLFNVQVYLSGGTILVGGVTRFKNEPFSKFTLAITGGTGRYGNVRGYVNVRQLYGGGTSLVFHLLP
jgi:hypothetical protein